MTERWGPYLLDLDVERTRGFYAGAPRLSSQCSCDGCRNFDRAADSLPLAAFFHRLGVDLHRVCEVYVLCTRGDGLVEYGGFTHICARRLEGAGELEPVPGFRLSFGEELSLLEDRFPMPALQVNFTALVPWVLDTENTDPREG